MSYNIRGKNDGSWEGRTPAKVIETITDITPDIIGFQEDDADWENYVAVLTGNGGSYYRLTGNDNGNEYLDIFYKKENFKECSVTGTVLYKKLAKEYTNVSADGADLNRDKKGDFSVELLGDKGRFFRYAVLETKDGVKVLVVNTHLHNGDSDADDLVRVYQMKLLCAWLADMEEDYPNQIVIGDLNGTPSELGRTLSDGGLTHARDTALVKGDVGGTLINHDENEPDLFYKKRETWLYDYVLYKNVRALEYTVVDNKNDANNTRYPSDHLPVIAKFICYAE